MIKDEERRLKRDKEVAFNKSRSRKQFKAVKGNNDS